MLGIIGGTGLNELPGIKQVEEKLLTTAYGMPSSSLITGHLQGMAVAFLARHGRPHCIPPHAINYRANLMALKQAGVQQIVAVNAVGGISEAQQSGVLTIPDQIMDYTWGRAHSFSDSAKVDLQHVDFTWPYSASLREKLLQAAVQAGVPVVDGAVHGVMQGPRLETAAEIRRLARDGCDIVGMTGMPEAALARELGLDYACISVVVNRAAGLSDELITMDAITAVTQHSMIFVRQLLVALCDLLRS